ncbi:LLM class flavin-dependent oxidoreductase [Ktedonosporobacter rubrisoli]|uniref:LLM class flavin-dependent oxidoreductase n=1 Tax=Ktedonosporobacter rubrisoli TaxID=2509675 RepID=A0A4P6JW33_KTERU|nr:LLM class flavin-dependent oxidoreductase [Ktedonosporobacter rubrisoli]QBD79582.1 LLM class flavin-dependent oxidoreductase [Ktedonosporobacter rubrisoli]
MKYGFVLSCGLDEVVELAQEAEAAGWDGIFLPDDWMAAWIKLTAIAMHTKRVLLGTMLTPLPEQDPWYVAAQTAILDRLSNGRIILTAGLGVLDLDKFGMQDNKVRAQRLDEALDILDHWWSGEEMRNFRYEGRYYRLQEMRADVDWRSHQPLQKPRIPIWVVGGPKQTQLRRAARWDGAVVTNSDKTLGAETLRERKAAILALRTSDRPLEFITEGETPADDPERAAAVVRPFAEAGATWWLESRWEWEGVSRNEEMRQRVRSGPPALR